MLVLRPGALGDTLLAVPALRALRRHFGRVTLYAHGPAARLLARLGEVDDGYAFDDASLGWLFRGESPPEPTIAWMSHPVRAALVWAPSRPSGAGDLLALSGAGAARHVAAYLLATLAPLGVDQRPDTRALRVTPIASTEILVHVGSGSRAKNWPAACFAATIHRLNDRRVRLIVGEADEDAAREVERLVGWSLPRLEADLHALAARLGGCRAYLGNDSGVSHLAGLSGARTVALFGPTSPAVWRPLGPNVLALPFEATPDEVASAVSA